MPILKSNYENAKSTSKKMTQGIKQISQQTLSFNNTNGILADDELNTAYNSYKLLSNSADSYFIRDANRVEALALKFKEVDDDSKSQSSRRTSNHTILMDK